MNHTIARVAACFVATTALAACGPSALPAAPALAEPAAEAPPTAEPAEAVSPICQPLPAHPVLARAPWDEPTGELLVVGKRVRVGEADRPFEVIDAHLLRTTDEGRCLAGRVALGEVTRPLPEPEKADQAPAALELKLLPLGGVETLDAPVGLERGRLPDKTTVVVVHLMRDVRWGLTERHAVPVTVRDGALIAGSSVQVGRDSMGPPVYYGTFGLLDSNGDGTKELVLRREGMGRFAKQVVFALDPRGVLQAAEQPVDPAGPPVSAAQRDGRDVAHALHVCGPRGARAELSAKPCPDGSKPKVERAGSVGMADDSHMIDAYKLACGRTIRTVHVDIYHCPGTP